MSWWSRGFIKYSKKQLSVTLMHCFSWASHTGLNTAYPVSWPDRVTYLLSLAYTTTSVSQSFLSQCKLSKQGLRGSHRSLKQNCSVHWPSGTFPRYMRVIGHANEHALYPPGSLWALSLNTKTVPQTQRSSPNRSRILIFVSSAAHTSDVSKWKGFLRKWERL